MDSAAFARPVRTHISSPPMYSPSTTSSPNLHCTISPRSPDPITRTIVPPPTGPAPGSTASTAADDLYSYPTASDSAYTSRLGLVPTITMPPSWAGAAHSAPYPPLRPATGAMLPNLHPPARPPRSAIPPKLTTTLTTVPPAWGPSHGSTPTTTPSSTYSYTAPLAVYCCPSSLTLTSTPTLPGPCAGASHITTADDTNCASTGAASPNPHTAPLPTTRCSPVTFTTPTPALGPEAGCTDTTIASTWYSNSTLLLLNPPSIALTSTATTPAAWGGAVHTTSTHPMHCSSRCHDAPPLPRGSGDSPYRAPTAPSSPASAASAP